MHEIDSCPFCSSSNVEVMCSRCDCGCRVKTFVKCHKCKAQGPESDRPIEAWNDRALNRRLEREWVERLDERSKALTASIEYWQALARPLAQKKEKS